MLLVISLVFMRGFLAVAVTALTAALAGFLVFWAPPVIASYVRTRDDLADLSTDELMEITAQDQEAANALIMQAREHWFTQNQA